MSNLILPAGLAQPERMPPPVHGPDAVMHLLTTALAHHLPRLSIFPIGEGLLMEAARSNDKRPAWIKIATLDSVVLNLVGNETLRDELLMIRIPREVVDKIRHPEFKMIVTPEEAMHE